MISASHNLILVASKHVGETIPHNWFAEGDKA